MTFDEWWNDLKAVDVMAPGYEIAQKAWEAALREYVGESKPKIWRLEQCARHVGMPYKGQATYRPPMPTICPNCRDERDISGERS